MVARKILSFLSRGGKNGDAVRGSECAKKPRRRVANRDGILHVHVHVVIQNAHEPLRHCRSCSLRNGSGFSRHIFHSRNGNDLCRRRLDVEKRHDLRFATVEQREILLMQIFDEFPLRISNDDADQDEIHADFEYRGRVARFDFRFFGLLRRSGSAGVLRGARRSLRGGGRTSVIASGRRLSKSKKSAGEHRGQQTRIPYHRAKIALQDVPSFSPTSATRRLS